MNILHRVQVRQRRRTGGRRGWAWAVLALGLGVAGCGTPRIQSSWTSPDLGQDPLRSVLVVMVDNSPILRGGLENSLVAELQSRGIEAQASHTTLALKTLREEPEAIQRQLSADGVDAVLLVRLAEEVPVERGREPSYTPYAGSYWGVRWHETLAPHEMAIYDPGYVDSRDIVRLETGLWSVQSERSLWGCLTQVTLRLDEDYVPKMHRFTRKVVRRMVNDGIIP